MAAKESPACALLVHSDASHFLPSLRGRCSPVAVDEHCDEDISVYPSSRDVLDCLPETFHALR